MRALDGAGRHAEALDAYGQARNVIADELGVDPGAELRHLHADMLAQDELLAKESGEAPGSISVGTVTRQPGAAGVRSRSRGGQDPATRSRLRPSCPRTSPTSPAARTR